MIWYSARTSPHLEDRMPNIGAVLREEIARLSRRENRSQIDKTRKATTLHHREIAQLKRQVVQLERQVKLLVRKGVDPARASTPTAANSTARFVAKGLRSQRTRLGLSAAEFGRLVGVSAQSIYNWEGGQARPRGEQLSRLASLRSLGKREAAARLTQAAGPAAKAGKRAATPAGKGGKRAASHAGKGAKRAASHAGKGRKKPARSKGKAARK